MRAIRFTRITDVHAPESWVIVNAVFVVDEAVVLRQCQAITLLAELDARLEQIHPWQLAESPMGLPVAG